MNIPVIEEPIRLPNNTPIYRYISESTAKKMFENFTIRFNSLKSWNDKIEGFMLEKAANLKNDYKNKIYVDQYHGSCWSIEINEKYFNNSDEYIFAKREVEDNGLSHMWESYCSGNGIRIKSTIGKVLNLFNEYGYEIYHGLI